MKRPLAAAIVVAIFAIGFWWLRKPDTRTPAAAGTAKLADLNNKSADPKRSPDQSRPSTSKDLNAREAALPKAARNSQPTVPELNSWTQTTDPFTGKVRTIEGPSLNLPGSDEKEKADAFITKNSKNLFGVPAEDLAFEKTNKAARTKVIYQQMTGGYPVYGSTLALLFENQELTRIQNDLQAGVKVPPKPEFQFEEIFEIYKQKPNGGLRMEGSVSSVTLAQDPSLMPRLVLYPSNQGLIFVYQFYVDEAPPQRHPARAMILFDPAGSRVVKKTSMHIE